MAGYIRRTSKESLEIMEGGSDGQNREVLAHTRQAKKVEALMTIARIGVLVSGAKKACHPTGSTGQGGMTIIVGNGVRPLRRKSNWRLRTSVISHHAKETVINIHIYIYTYAFHVGCESHTRKGGTREDLWKFQRSLVRSGCIQQDSDDEDKNNMAEYFQQGYLEKVN